MLDFFPGTPLERITHYFNITSTIILYWTPGEPVTVRLGLFWPVIPQVTVICVKLVSTVGSMSKSMFFFVHVTCYILNTYCSQGI
jgi:hypothetical protein